MNSENSNNDSKTAKPAKKKRRHTFATAIEDTFNRAPADLTKLVKEEFRKSGINSAQKLRYARGKIGDHAIRESFFKYALDISKKIANNDNVDEALIEFIKLYAKENRYNYESIISPRGLPLLANIVHEYYGSYGMETILGKLSQE